jgi:hypothetical protein
MTPTETHVVPLRRRVVIEESKRGNMEDDTGRAIVIALVHTNSTCRLAPLDGMILVGTHEQELNTPTAIFRYWEWESVIPLPTDTTTIATTIPEELPPQMDDTITTTTTNATTAADDTNANIEYTVSVSFLTLKLQKRSKK